MMTLLSKDEAYRLSNICLSNSLSSSSSSSIHIRRIARLWGGMGEIYQISTERGDSFIVKYIQYTASSIPSIGDQRKLDSYRVEVNFYQKYSHDLRLKGIGIAQCYHVEEKESAGATKHKAAATTTRTQTKTIICLSVLQDAPDENFVEQTLEWLAKFHAATWGHGNDNGWIQSVGTYWHLDTRHEEWKQMKTTGWEGRLRQAAKAIDQWLKETTPIQSWVHGDCKDANVMWDGTQVALCDFQYVGVGCPLKDVCYFLCSSGISSTIEETRYVNYYYETLCQHLTCPPPSRHDVDVALELCYCDYQRFLCGWGQWGSDISKRVQSTLQKIDKGKNLGSDEAYEVAIYEAFD
jgi:thiamine kinase-like enzyme